MDNLNNLRSLLFNIYQNFVIISIKSNFRERISNLSAHVANDFLIVHISLGCDFAYDCNILDFLHVSQSTILSGSCSKHASKIASDIWSQSLSGLPSFTDSEVRRKVCRVKYRISVKGNQTYLNRKWNMQLQYAKSKWNKIFLPKHYIHDDCIRVQNLSCSYKNYIPSVIHFIFRFW